MYVVFLSPFSHTHTHKNEVDSSSLCKHVRPVFLDEGPCQVGSVTVTCHSRYDWGCILLPNHGCVQGVGEKPADQDGERLVQLGILNDHQHPSNPLLLQLGISFLFVCPPTCPAAASWLCRPALTRVCWPLTPEWNFWIVTNQIPIRSHHLPLWRCSKRLSAGWDEFCRG